MSEWRDEAIVLRLNPFREIDARVNLLSRTSGLVTAFAFGAFRSLRRFCGCLDTLNTLACRFTIAKRGEYQVLEEATLLDGPGKLRGNWRNMGVVANCSRFVEAMGVNEESARESFLIVENLRDTLAASDFPNPPGELPFFFRLRMAQVLGFGPNFSACGKCGDKNAGYFLVREGFVICGNCLKKLPFSERNYGLNLSPPALETLRFVQNSLPGEWISLRLDGLDKRRIARAIDGFTQFHLGLEWEKGYFRKI